MSIDTTPIPTRPPAGTLAFLYWLPVGLFVALIFAVSSKQDLKPPVTFPLWDKTAHIFEYGALGVLLRRALRATAPRAPFGRLAAIAIVSGFLVGVSDEWFQRYVPGRQSTVYDLFADAVGLTLAQLAPRRLVPE